MKLKWQQKQLLSILGELDSDNLLSQVDTHLMHGKEGDYFFMEGARTFQDGTLYDFEKRYPADYVYPLKKEGFITLKSKGKDTFDILPTARGMDLIRHRFKE